MSPLSNHMHVVKRVPVDYMHCVLEGVTSWLLKAWTDSKYSGNCFSIRRHLSVLDSNFLKQRPPTEFTRSPRSIKTHLSYWKASEFRNWLLFYSLPLLVNILPPLTSIILRCWFVQCIFFCRERFHMFSVVQLKRCLLTFTSFFPNCMAYLAVL